LVLDHDKQLGGIVSLGDLTTKACEWPRPVEVVKDVSEPSASNR